MHLHARRSLSSPTRLASASDIASPPSDSTIQTRITRLPSCITPPLQLCDYGPCSIACVSHPRPRPLSAVPHRIRAPRAAVDPSAAPPHMLLPTPFTSRRAHHLLTRPHTFPPGMKTWTLHRHSGKRSHSPPNYVARRFALAHPALASRAVDRACETNSGRRRAKKSTEEIQGARWTPFTGLGAYV